VAHLGFSKFGGGTKKILVDQVIRTGVEAPGSNLTPLKFSELLFILFIFSIFLLPNARSPILKYFCPTLICFLVVALAEGHGDLGAESPVAGALSRFRKNCNLWDYINPTMILFKLCNNNKVLGHRFRMLSIGPKSFFYILGLELNGAELLFFGAVHKRRPHKIAKNWPPPLLPCPQNVRTGSTPLPTCPCGHTINFKKTDEFLHQNVQTSTSEEPSSPLSTKCPNWTKTPPLTADVFYRRPLCSFIKKVCLILFKKSGEKTCYFKSTRNQHVLKGSKVLPKK